MSNLRNLIRRIVEEEMEDLEEDMSTGEGEVYLTPKAFTAGKERDINDPVYKKKLKGQHKLNSVNPNNITEISYNAYKNNPDKTEKEKINGNFQEIYKRLKEVEQLMAHAKKLKTEIGQDQVYWKDTTRKFGKISEKLNSISIRIKEMWS